MGLPESRHMIKSLARLSSISSAAHVRFMIACMWTVDASLLYAANDEQGTVFPGLYIYGPPCRSLPLRAMDGPRGTHGHAHPADRVLAAERTRRHAARVGRRRSTGAVVATHSTCTAGY